MIIETALMQVFLSYMKIFTSRMLSVHPDWLLSSTVMWFHADLRNTNTDW